MRALNERADIKNKICTLKDQLYAAKSQLDNIHRIELITRALDPFKAAKYQIAKNIGEEHVSNAWLKCFDIIMKFDLLSGKDIIRHYDGAALPGAFILATKYIVQHYAQGCDYKWRACSLYDPNKPHLGDDYGLIRQFPNNWLMGEKNNGDITDIANIRDITARLLNKTNFYTSDLGFDVSHDYNKQEILHFCANTGQILLCLKILQAGGVCIIKHYTCLEEYTLKYLDKFSNLFKKFHLYKPAASKSLNSEIYLVGIGFIGYEAPACVTLAADLEYCLINRSFSLEYNFPLAFVKSIWHRMQLRIINQIYCLDKVMSIARAAGLTNTNETEPQCNKCTEQIIAKEVRLYGNLPVVEYNAGRLFKLGLRAWAR